MMLKKEQYTNAMFELEHLQLAVVKEPQLKFLESHQRKLVEQQKLALESEQEYRGQLGSFNQAVELVQTSYVKNLERIEGNDLEYTEFVKSNF